MDNKNQINFYIQLFDGEEGGQESGIVTVSIAVKFK